MSKKLMIVESPAKARTINKYLGDDFVVEASYGHVRDLPASRLGVDIEKDFEPEYIIPPKAKKNVSAIRKLAKSSAEIYLATDLDREGEAIAWHIAEAIGLGSTKHEARNSKIKRITFHEISKEAILEAIKHPREIDMNMVDAQQARRVLDRLVGYNLSPLLWKKVYKGLSAGRVQSVAVRLVVEREREIEAFKPEEYWSVVAILEKDKIDFEARLVEENGKKIEKLDIKSENEAQRIVDELEKGEYRVAEVKYSVEKRNPSAPFTTSTMQQEAHNRLGFSAKQTMRAAQVLYEAGHITYMRTDSVSISSAAQGKIRNFIVKKYGEQYISDSNRVFKTKTKNAQEAHEAIRPVDVSVEPSRLSLESSVAKLYDLIWRRTVASQMKEAELNIVEVKSKNNEFGFLSRGQMLKFKGYLELYPDKVTEINLPQLKEGDRENFVEMRREQHFTEPPPRYSEATLIKALEEKGIGRPSTYAPTMSTIQDRGYVVKDSGRLKPEKVGFVVNDLLVKNFGDIVDYSFTATIENELDDVAEGKIKWQKVIGDFYGPFEKDLEKKADTIEKTTMDEELDEICPDCAKMLIIKHSRRGKFIGCSGFPDCHFTRPFLSEKEKIQNDEAEKQIEGRKCPECKSDLKIARGKYGPFIGCSGYPKCKYIEKIKNSKS